MSQRTPLAPGRRYIYPLFPDAGILVRAVEFPGRPGYDGGWPGVSVQFIGNRPLGRRVKHAWYSARSEDEFWSKPQFAPLVDASEAA